MLDRDKLEAAKVAFDARFNAALASLAAPDAFFSQLAEKLDMTKPTIEFNWMGFPGSVKKWDGPRKLEKLGGKNYRIATEEWENSIRASRKDIRDDSLALYNSRIDMLAMTFRDAQLELLAAALVAGFSTASDFGSCYDGTAFFGNSHPLDNGATNDNLLTATLDDTDALDDAILLMRTMKRDDGKPLNLSPTHLLCGPTVEKYGRAILLQEFGSGGESNTNFGRVTLHVSPYITDGKWFLLDLSKPVKPLFYGEREAVWSDSVVTGDEAFMTGELKFGAAASYNAAFAFYQLAIGSSATT